MSGRGGCLKNETSQSVNAVPWAIAKLQGITSYIMSQAEPTPFKP
jgi:hypothetical protein